MMSGHIMLKVLIGFAWTMMHADNILVWLGHLAPLLVVFVLIGLELAIAVIQAYVFTILTCLFINESIELH
jgi:F0F1-type ATP synthase membrane subunit a